MAETMDKIITCLDVDNSNVVYAYTPEGWDETRWRELGAFTVVFLNFEKEKMIRRSVASALEQDYPLLEMFFMDDASQDGSGDVMESLVREYRGRHKVSVVRNKKNVGICGQWNAVAKLAKGEWLGMFCADDIAHRDRVSVVSERIKKYPSLLALCTGLDPRDSRDGRLRSELRYPRELTIAYGDDAPEILIRKKWPVGATSFYRRSLFDVALPLTPLDDLYIKWRLHMESIGVNGPVWMLDSTISTIDYFVGEGLWSSIRASRPSGISDDEWRERRKKTAKRVCGLAIETWIVILRDALTRRVGSGFICVALKEILRLWVELFHIDGDKCSPLQFYDEDGHGSLSILLKEFPSPGECISALCGVAVSLQNDIHERNVDVEKMRATILKLKKSKRHKNRLIVALLFVACTLLAVVLI